MAVVMLANGTDRPFLQMVRAI